MIYSIQTPTTPGPALWNPPDAQPVAEVLLSIPCSLIAMNERHGNHVMPASYSAYGPGQNVTHWGSPATLEPHDFVANFARSTVSVSSRYKQINTLAFVSRPKVRGPMRVIHLQRVLTTPAQKTARIPRSHPFHIIPLYTNRLVQHLTFASIQPQLGSLKQFLVLISLFIVCHTRSLPVYLAAHVALMRMSAMVYGSTKNSSMV